MKNYEFMILGATDDSVFGYGVNRQRTVQWMYYPKTGVLDVYKTPASMNFFEQLKDFLLREEENIVAGNYFPSASRREQVTDWLVEKEIYQS